MTTKISIQLLKVKDETGAKNIEVIMDLGDFETSGTSIRTVIIKFKEKYLQAIKDAKKIGAFDKEKKLKTKKVSTKLRWKACKIIADFNQDARNKFVITNYKTAYARDFGIPMRSIRTYIDFGSTFSEEEILDNIPYSLYAEFVFKVNELTKKGLLDSEKDWLLSSAKNETLPDRNEYREHLRDVIR